MIKPIPCLLAMGLIDVVIESSLKAWDVQALIPIVEGAGGTLTSWDGGRCDEGHFGDVHDTSSQNSFDATLTAKISLAPRCSRNIMLNRHSSFAYLFKSYLKF